MRKSRILKGQSAQVYRIENRKRVIDLHIGTAKTNEVLDNLISIYKDFISKYPKQLQLFIQNIQGSIIDISKVNRIETLLELLKVTCRQDHHLLIYFIALYV